MFDSISLPNIINLLLGILLGFFIMVFLSFIIICKLISKNNNNEEIKKISKKAYVDFYSKNSNIKDKIISSLFYEVKEVASLIENHGSEALLNLSFNDFLNGINIIQRKLSVITNHPLCYDIKHMHIAKILTIEGSISKSINIIYKRKTTKTLITIYNVTWFIINLFNPIYYIRKLLTAYMMKNGEKNVVLAFLNFIGNTTYQIYNNQLEKEYKEE